MPALSVTVLGHAACPDAAAVRTTLDAAGIAYDTVPLDAPDADGQAGDDCGYTSPTVQVAGTYGGPTVLVRPDPDALPARLALLGVAVGTSPDAPHAP